MKWVAHKVKEQLYIPQFYSMDKHDCDKSYIFHGETHNFWECVYVISGSICVSADERVYNMSEGEIIFHKPYELHKFYTTGGKNAELFIFSYTLRGELSDFFSQKVFYLSENQQEIIEKLIEYMQSKYDEFNISTNGKLINYLKLFDKIPAYSQTVLTQIYSLLFSIYNSSESIPVTTTHDSLIFSEAINYMNSKIYESPSVEEISKEVGISQSGLKRIFKKYSGLGVHKYFLKLKLKHAAKMLESGISVTDVAETLRFSSQGYFTKTFQRETGFLPSTLTKKS